MSPPMVEIEPGFYLTPDRIDGIVELKNRSPARECLVRYRSFDGTLHHRISPRTFVELTLEVDGSRGHPSSLSEPPPSPRDDFVTLGGIRIRASEVVCIEPFYTAWKPGEVNPIRSRIYRRQGDPILSVLPAGAVESLLLAATL